MWNLMRYHYIKITNKTKSISDLEVQEWVRQFDKPVDNKIVDK